MVPKKPKAYYQKWNIKSSSTDLKMRCIVQKWSNAMYCKEAKWKASKFCNHLWEVIYVHFNNWDRSLDLVPIVYDLIKLIIKASLWFMDYSTFDTHTQHTRLLFNKCLFHLCDCTWSNVMCMFNYLSIKPKKIFEYFICFWKCFYAFVF